MKLENGREKLQEKQQEKWNEVKRHSKHRAWGFDTYYHEDLCTLKKYGALSRKP